VVGGVWWEHGREYGRHSWCRGYAPDRAALVICAWGGASTVQRRGAVHRRQTEALGAKTDVAPGILRLVLRSALAPRLTLVPFWAFGSSPAVGGHI